MSLSADLDTLVEASLMKINNDDEVEGATLCTEDVIELSESETSLQIVHHQRKARKRELGEQHGEMDMMKALMTRTSYHCKYFGMYQHFANKDIAFAEMKKDLVQTQVILSDRYSKTFAELSPTSSAKGTPNIQIVVSDLERVMSLMLDKVAKSDRIISMCKANLNAYMVAKAIEEHLSNAIITDVNLEYQRLWLSFKSNIYYFITKRLLIPS